MNLELRGIIFKDKATITELYDYNLNEAIWNPQEPLDHVADSASCVEARLVAHDNFWKNPKKGSKSWKLVIRQDKIPSWFHKEHRKMFRIAADAWWTEHVLVQKEITSLSGGVYFLKDCTVSMLCGNARILCEDTRIDHMKDSSTVLKASGNTIIKHMQGHSVVKQLNDNSLIYYVRDSAKIEHMNLYSNIHSLGGNAQIICMDDHSQVFKAYQQSKIVIMRHKALVHSVSQEAVIEEMQDMSFVAGLSGNAKVRQISSGHAIVPISNTDDCLPFH